MRWTYKAWAQKAFASLPPWLGDPVYYAVQRKFGGMRFFTPGTGLKAGISIAERIAGQGQSLTSKTCLEIGTGWALNLPIALWLCGAARIITIDINPYIKPELVLATVSYLKANQDAVSSMFGRWAMGPLFEERYRALLTAESADQVFGMTGIRYCAPTSATCLELESQSVDYYVSYAVLEHIPPTELAHVLSEAHRALKRTGLFIHCVDFSDHFAHSDTSIPSIHFLRFTDKEWDRYAGNRFMYHNRLRLDDLLGMFEEAGLEVVTLDPVVDQRALTLIKEGFLLDARFRPKPPKINATVAAWIVATTRALPQVEALTRAGV